MRVERDYVPVIKHGAQEKLNALEIAVAESLSKDQMRRGIIGGLP
jgi:hypothetical protein